MYHSGVPLVSMMFWAYLIEKCSTFLLHACEHYKNGTPYHIATLLSFSGDGIKRFWKSFKFIMFFSYPRLGCLNNVFMYIQLKITSSTTKNNCWCPKCKGEPQIRQRQKWWNKNEASGSPFVFWLIQSSMAHVLKMLFDIITYFNSIILYIFYHFSILDSQIESGMFKFKVLFFWPLLSTIICHNI